MRAILFGIRTYLPREGPETRLSNQILRIVPYKNLSTSRGAGNGQRIGASVPSGKCIDTYLPREGTETLMIWPEFKFTTVSIAPYQPREGPETISCELSKNHNARIDTYQPREGPETRCRIPHQRFLALLGIDAYLPREGPETLRSEMRSPIRGNGIDTYLPREGPETG